MRGFRPQRRADPPARTAASARAYTELRRKILHGELPPGAVLGEAEAAAMLGVSRTPVREALRELLNEGLLDEGPRRQVLVAGAPVGLRREVQLMRDTLERIAAREAATQMEVTDVDQLRLIMIRTRRALASGAVNAFLDCDDEFHLHIPRSVGLLLTEDVLHRLRGFTRLAALGADWTVADLERSADEHDAIIDAIASGDPDAAETAMTTHLSSSDALTHATADIAEPRHTSSEQPR